MASPSGTGKIAYFSMEIALTPSIPTYSGGLGILAGDMLRSAADIELPMVGVTLVYRKGYFRQRLDANGTQHEEPDEWNPESQLQPETASATVEIEGRKVRLRVWRYDIVGMSGHTVPVYLLDANVPENTPGDRALTDSLYGGDSHYRICQETLLGYGGISLLRSLGFGQRDACHMNEGHSSLLTLALLEEQLQLRNTQTATDADINAVRRQCIFTTHTPVPAGHDKFPPELARQVLGERRSQLLERTGCCRDGMLNMTFLALRFSHYINGVALRHEEVSRDMFPVYPIHAITNGVHAVTWTSAPFQELYDRHIPEWRRDNAYLRYAVGVHTDDIQQAHARAKAALLDEVKRRSGVALDASVLTLGFARRAAAYKRADLLFSDRERLRAIAQSAGSLQIIYAGKAHPADQAGKDLIRRVVEAGAQLNNDIRFVYLENYDWALARLLTSGVDLWLNTPQRPQEASGTSGMKAALNGVPSLSILDGWWIEGCFEGITGWAIGHDATIREGDARADATSLYEKLERQIVPLFYQHREAYAEIMRSAIAVNGSFFNTQRMLAQYETNAYFPETLTIPERALL
ncbi:MAG TPA: alpha-glucan family phosphorylase [Terriglobia bacterium]|nr:alpha-glucan family phosphorylase [Terriglobia bacterium]